MRLLDFTTSWAEFLRLAVFFLFGALMAQSLEAVTIGSVVYALLSLTVVRMVPVALVLTGSGMHRATVGFLGWFGARGMTAIVMGLVFLGTGAHLASERLILHAVGLTALLSIFTHGLTVRPLSDLYVRLTSRLDDDAPENRGSERATGRAPQPPPPPPA